MFYTYVLLSSPMSGDFFENKHLISYCFQVHPVSCRHLSVFELHPKFRTINLHNVTHSSTSRNLREWMFVVQISLFIVTFLSLISRNLSLIQTTKEVNPHPRTAPCVNMWSATFLFLFLCHLLNVGACICHIALEGKVEWTTPYH
jgi:hypothetical protein